MKIIILNGAPRTGKDTLGNYCHGQDSLFWIDQTSDTAPAKAYSFYLESFAQPIKDALITFFSLTSAEYDYFNNEGKDIPSDRLFGKTFRHWCKQFSETLVKPNSTLSAFGDLMVNRIKNNVLSAKFNYIVTDSGFDDEIEPLIKEFGAENISVVKIFMDGHDFTNDTRRYLDCQKLGVREYHIENVKGSIDKFREEGYKLICDIINESVNNE